MAVGPGAFYLLFLVNKQATYEAEKNVCHIEGLRPRDSVATCVIEPYSEAGSRYVHVTIPTLGGKHCVYGNFKVPLF